MIRVHKNVRPWNYNFVARVKFKHVECIGREKMIIIFFTFMYINIICVWDSRM